MISIVIYVAAFIISLFTCLMIRKLLMASRIYDLPKNDRWHTREVPKFGGVGIFVATMVAWLIYFG